jgi:hypothetical protein
VLWLKEVDNIGFVACNKLAQYNEFKEVEVIQILKRFLVDMRYTIIYEGRRQGPDIVAHCKDSLLVIEARGVPSRFKVKGRDRGKLKSIHTVRG